MKTENKKQISLDVTTIVAIIGVFITILALGIGATFKLTKYSNNQANVALQTTITTEKGKNRGYEKKLEEKTKLLDNLERRAATNYLPAKQVAEGLNNPEIEALATKVEQLEEEKRQLLSEIASKAIKSLDPIDVQIINYKNILS